MTATTTLPNPERYRQIVNAYHERCSFVFDDNRKGILSSAELDAKLDECHAKFLYEIAQAQEEEERK